MIEKTVVAVMFLSMIGTAWADEKASPLRTVEYVDLDRYVGLWYEIAKVPNRFQKQCVRGTTAQYTIRDDGRIDVINRCIEEDGSIDEAKGIAKVEDRISNAKLKVNFFRLLGIRLFWGNYWIIGLGNDYEYAIVGSPDRKYGWVLSRTPHMQPETLERVFEELRAKGYNPDDFDLTVHEVENSFAK